MNFGTIAFGQRFEVTPIQMITMVSTIANGGTYIQPRVVKATIDSKTKEKTEVEIKCQSESFFLNMERNTCRRFSLPGS